MRRAEIAEQDRYQVARQREFRIAANVVCDAWADFAEVEGGENVAGGLFDLIPESGFGRQEIAGAFDGLELGFVGHFVEGSRSLG